MVIVGIGKCWSLSSVAFLGNCWLLVTVGNCKPMMLVKRGLIAVGNPGVFNTKTLTSKKYTLHTCFYIVHST